jgi:acetyl esterase/lipase
VPGVWAAGERWHYSPLAARLAQLGVVACVVSYTLYPQALLPQMVEEVSAAFGWVLDHAAEYGGDPTQVGGG